MIIRTTRATSNLRMLEFVASKLGQLKDSLVFLGGCATTLLITDTAVPDVRYTLDVDCIVDVISLSQYHRLERQLQKLGFNKSLQDDIICRWHYEDVILDVMPTDEKILGFGNCWYKEAIHHAMVHRLSEDLTIHSVTAPYFLATKLEAFKGRGKGDFLGSHDFEDIVTVIDGRMEIEQEIATADDSLKRYLSENFSTMLQLPTFQAALPGHLSYGPMTKNRAELVWKRIQRLAQYNKEQ